MPRIELVKPTILWDSQNVYADELDKKFIYENSTKWKLTHISERQSMAVYELGRRWEEFQIGRRKCYRLTEMFNVLILVIAS
jgi:hypothetical protein